MPSPITTFLDFNLPNATTWFCFSFLLAMAFYFKFSRLLSMRNLDVVMMFLLVPGLLVVQSARVQPTFQIASLIGNGALGASPVTLTMQLADVVEQSRWHWFGYLWLMVGSVYFFCRCLLDLTLVQRPALGPNLQTGGLGWLAGAFLICLLAVAYRQVERYIPALPLAANGASDTSAPTPTVDQGVFAVAILWRDWPAWAVAVLAFGCHIAVVVALASIAWQQFQDIAAGMAAVTFYLLLPYTGFHVGQLHHVLPMALFLGAILAYRAPLLAGGVLGVAAAATYFPVFVLPIWLSFYRGRGMGRFLIAFLAMLALSLAGIGLALSSAGELTSTIHQALGMSAAEAAATTEGFWAGVHWAYRIPVFLLFLSFVVATMFWPAPKNLAHVIALCAAVFIALQWWGAEHGGIYVLWYLPLMLLMVFRPNLQDREAPPIVEETDWLCRSWQWVKRKWRRETPTTEPVEKQSV
jgi:hypothetical protein